MKNPQREKLSLSGITKLFKPVFHHFVGKKRHLISHQKMNKGIYSSSNYHPLSERNATVPRFLGNFSYKTTQMFREINFRVFRKLLRRSRLKSIAIDIDSSVVNVEGRQEGTAKG
jgi:hypothetical protein